MLRAEVGLLTNERRFQAFVVLRTGLVRFSGLLSINGKKIGTGVIGPRWLKGPFESGIEVVSPARNTPVVAVIQPTHHFGYFELDQNEASHP